MKKIIAMAALILFGGVYAKASNYPSDYTYQTARVVHVGPAIVAKVSSGVMEKLVIGYKNSGLLAGSDSIDAVVRIVYADHSGYPRTAERVVHMPKEWHGTGFMSEPMSVYSFLGGGYAEILRIEIAFSNGAQWDSRNGANYTMEMDDMYWHAVVYKTGHSGSATDIDLNCWDFIVDEMRR